MLHTRIRPLRPICLLLVALAFSSNSHLAAQRIDEFADLKTISKLPLTIGDVELEFSRSRRDACEIIPQGESLEIRSFTTILTERDKRESRTKRLLPSSRRDVFSVGLEFDRNDAADLPVLSRGTITEYLDDHFVSIQARMRRDLLDQKLYFHHRPLALTAQFRGSKTTQNFEPIVSASIREFHSLGLFATQEESRKKPETFRTLVLLFKTNMLRPNSKLTREVFEFAFIRGKEVSGGLELDPHVFVTSENRTELAYLNVSRRPTTATKCSIVGRIAVTDFDSTGIFPKESATRSYVLDDRMQIPIRALDDYCRKLRLKGGFGENLSVALDALIDGEITAEPAQSLQPPSDR